MPVHRVTGFENDLGDELDVVAAPKGLAAPHHFLLQFFVIDDIAAEGDGDFTHEGLPLDRLTLFQADMAHAPMAREAVQVLVGKVVQDLAVVGDLVDAAVIGGDTADPAGRDAGENRCPGRW